jgi:hypothetical protein
MTNVELTLLISLEGINLEIERNTVDASQLPWAI